MDRDIALMENFDEFGGLEWKAHGRMVMGRMSDWRSQRAWDAMNDPAIDAKGDVATAALLREAQLEFGRALVEHLRAEGCLSWKSGWPVEVDVECLVDEL